MSMRSVFVSAAGLALAASAGIASAASPVVAGRQLASSQNCLMCHASGGAAKPLSAYAGDSAGQLDAAILDPKKALGPATMMPSYQGRLSGEQLAALVAFIKAGGK